jgi:hypothetical protein
VSVETIPARLSRSRPRRAARGAIVAVAATVTLALAAGQAHAATSRLTLPTATTLRTSTAAPTVTAPATPSTTQTAPPPPAQQAFYSYTGSKPLKDIAPGTVLNTRTIDFHVAGISLPVTVVQLLYRSTTVLNTPTTNVTSVLLPPTPSLTPRLVAYNSFYDSTTSEDEPSYSFYGAPYDEGRELTTIETGDLSALLLAGDTVSVADTEGQAADFATGPEYGMLTLDGIRAALNSPADKLSSTTPIALMGYSGGAIATGWAAQMAPSYAPAINKRLVGATMGGVLVEPDHNLHYIEGSSTWAGVMPMALVGITRAYDINIQPYLSTYGQQVVKALEATSIGTAEDDYAGITWTQIAKPQYPEPETVAPFVTVANKLILGHDALPKVPLQITQGDQGELDGTTNDQSGIGPGDGVMIAGDVRSYAREACAAGDPVDYTEIPTDHEGGEPVWSAEALTWLATRFAGVTAPSDCSTIAAGNPLTPVSLQPAG